MSDFFGGDLVEKLEDSYWHPQTGLTVTRRFEGAPDKIAGAAVTLRAAGWEVDITNPDDGGYAVMRAVGSTTGLSQNQDEPLSDRWAQFGNDKEESLWAKPEVASLLNRIPPDKTLAALDFRSCVDAMLGGARKFTKEDGTEIVLTPQNVVSELNNALQNTYTTDELNYLLWFIRELALGFEAFPLSQYVLRREIVVPRGTNIRPAYENVNRVYGSNSSLALAEGLPNDVLADLPPAGVWLKRTPNKEQIAADKWLISMEWWHGDYASTFIHGRYI